jgi:hypothetical protein
MSPPTVVHARGNIMASAKVRRIEIANRVGRIRMRRRIDEVGAEIYYINSIELGDI